MNIITDFLIENYILLIMLVGMFIITLFDVYLDRSMIYKLRTVLGLILLLVVFDHLETYTGNLEHFTRWRILLSILCYSLRPTIILMLIFIVSPKISKLIAIAQSFCRVTGKKERVYRIGGDEFVIISRKSSTEEMEKLLDRLKAGVDEIGYSCAFGLSFHKTPDEMLAESDELMYQDKARIKKELEQQGVIHRRS